MAYRYNPFTGTLDNDDISSGQSIPSDVAKEISIRVTLGETLSALKVFYIGSDGRAYAATADNSFEKSQAVGILKQSGLENETVDGLLFGRLDDPFFNFPINADLYLGSSGNITDQDPQQNGLLFFKIVAQSLGSGSIFFNIKQTITL